MISAFRISQASGASLGLVAVGSLLLGLYSTPAFTAEPVRVRFSLPSAEAGGPDAWHVTLAAAPADQPAWLVSTFVASRLFTVTADNRGEFEATWDGLDDNGMPLPPGEYVIRGIRLPAQPWPVGGGTQAIAPRFLMGVGDSWTPGPDGGGKPVIIKGHQFGFMTDVAAADSGRAAFLSGYIESGRNPFLVDLHREIGYEQVVETYNSFGGMEGGPAVAYDGEHVWVSNSWGWIIRGDQQWGGEATPVGVRGITLPMASPSLAARFDAARGERRLYVALTATAEGTPVNEVRVYDGDSAVLLDTLVLDTPRAVFLDRAAPGSRLLALHLTPERTWAVSAVALDGGRPVGAWQQLFTLADVSDPADCVMGSDGRFYVADSAGDAVLQLDAAGTIVQRIGLANPRQPGPFDTGHFYKPARLSVWRQPGDDADRLLVVEHGLTGRISEWHADGRFIRQWFLSRGAVNGYCVDPLQPEHLYIAADTGVMRFAVDYDRATWTPDAVFPDLALRVGIYPQVVAHGGQKYLCFGGGQGASYNHAIYRWNQDRWVASAGIIWASARGEAATGGYWWSDADGDGVVQDNELGPYAELTEFKGWWGNRFLDDMSLALAQTQEPGATGWPKRGYNRLPPRNFDGHGNPVYHLDDLQPMVTDDIHHRLAMRQLDPANNPPLDARRGGNEAVDVWNGGWGSPDGSPDGPIYVSSGFGPPNPGGLDLGGSRTTHEKLMRFDRGDDGGYRMTWRVGRKAWRVAQPGDIYSSFFTTKPAHGIVGIQDQNGVYHLFNEEGFFVDTLMWDHFLRGHPYANHYSHGGEMWFGRHIQHPITGKVYLLMGRSAANIYECVGWTRDAVQPVEVLGPKVTLTAAQIAPADEFAVAVRGGHGPARIARFQPAPGGGPALDAPAEDWASASPIAFGLDEQRKAEVRAMYDPDHIFLRWHVRTPSPAPLADSADPRRMFAHNFGADTFSFYLQGDPDAAPASDEGRPGDVRLLFGLRKTQSQWRPIVVGMYHTGPPGRARPMTYASPVRRVTFGHVAPLTDVRTHFAMDDDGQGYVLTAAIPRSVLPPETPPFDADLKSLVNFSVTLQGTIPFWWANTGGVNNTLVTDEPAESMLYPGSWAQAQFAPIQSLTINPWLTIGPWGGPAMRQMVEGWNEGHAYAKQVFEATVYPPDHGEIDPSATFEGELTIDAAGQPRRLAWKAVAANARGVVPLGGNDRQLHHLVAWIESPKEVTLPVEIVAPVTIFGGSRLLVNDEEVPGEANADYGVAGRQVAAKTITLKQGWNKIVLRSYWLWGGFEAGVILHGDPDDLWPLRLATRPPRAQP